jgi:hypothetical protein
MKSTTEKTFQTSVVARLSGEDIEHGDFITVSTELMELPSFFWCCCDSALPADEPVRLRFVPDQAGQPFKVVTLCLPFVYAKNASNKLITFDVRQQQLVRLDRKCARKVWKRLKAAVQPKTI